MVNKKALREHLDARCPQENLSEKDGIVYLSIDKCERMLDILCEEFDLMWGTRNYRSTIIVVNAETEKPDLLISASLELSLYGEGYHKVLVGTTTFYASDYTPNTYFDSIAKSLCTVNAASDLGDFFGRFLANQESKSGFPSKPKEKKARQSVKLKPDKDIRQKYAKAVAAGKRNEVASLEGMYDFN